MDTERESCDRNTVLSVRLEKKLLWKPSRNWRLSDMFCDTVFVDKCAILQRYWFYTMVSEQDNHSASVPGIGFMLGCEYNAIK